MRPSCPQASPRPAARLAALLICTALLGAACDGGPVDAAPTWHADIQPIVEAHCADCHDESGVAPFTLRSYDDVVDLAPLVRSVVERRTMPPWGATDADVPLKFDISLSDEQIAAVAAWVDAGTPEGDPDAPGEPIVLERNGIPRVDLELTMPEPYTPQVAPGQDEYRCFLFEWPHDDPIQVTGFEFVPGNLSTVHHAVAYLVTPRSADLAYEFETWDEGPGYDCYGAASHTDFEQDILAGEFFDQRYVAAWAPGLSGQVYGEGGIGIEVAPGSVIVLQLHYSANTFDGAPDQSAVRFALDEQTDREGYYMPWMNLGWPAAPSSMAIPAGEVTSHSFRAEATTSGNATLLGAPAEEIADGMLLHGVFAHMHLLGTRMLYQLHRTDGTTTTLLDLDRYDFDWQREYVFDEPVAVAPGDELEVTCTWDNTEGFRTRAGAVPAEPLDVRWGEASNDEMCVAHTLITAP